MTTVVRPATDADADLLVDWHADPETSKYWDDETFTRGQILDRLHREAVDAWIVESDNAPVGYLQSWWETDVGSTESAKSEGAGLAGAGADTDPPKRGGLDGFLVPAARGRGLMPDAARALARHLLDEGWAYVTVDPYEWNERAVHAWRAAGFVPESRHEPDEDHASAWILMRFDPAG